MNLVCSTLSEQATSTQSPRFTFQEAGNAKNSPDCTLPVGIENTRDPTPSLSIMTLSAGRGVLLSEVTTMPYWGRLQNDAFCPSMATVIIFLDSVGVGLMGISGPNAV